MEDLRHPDAGKRKRSPADSLVDGSIPSLSQRPFVLGSTVSLSEAIERNPPHKRPRLPAKPPPPDHGQLSAILCFPNGILQAILLCLDPVSLSRLTCVHRRFYDLLDPSHPTLPDQSLQKSHHGSTIKDNVYSVHSKDIIWTISRKNYLPGMPKPMDGLSERDFLALAFGTACQFCGTRSPPSRGTSQDPGKVSPGEPAVFIVWSFKIRSCMQCLAPHLRKDSEVFVSNASPLRPALPFAFFTQSLQLIPQYLCNDPLPPGINLQKYFYAPEIDKLEKEAESVQEFGSGAVEEWLKGLPHRGQHNQRSTMQLEAWQSDGGLEAARRLLFGKMDTFNSAPDKSFASSAQQHHFPIPTNAFNHTTRYLSSTSALPAMPLQPYGLAPGLEPQAGLPPRPSDASSMGSQTSNRKYKTAPSSRELARIRAYKKEDIIVRCRTLNPRITKDMLERLDAFENALRVPMPLNDSSWEALKDLLLQQKRQVELQDEARNSANVAPTPGHFIAPLRSDEYVLAHADVPTKDKLCEIAQEYIKQRFGHGAWITYPTAPQFAAEVLIHVRQTYVEEKARIQELRAESGFLSLDSPQEELLRYEHMKWVFEQTIKPRTEQTRKDLFLCAICPTNASVKYFAFESMIQHFAFKHDPNFTTEAPRAFWKCEWPAVPPFDAHPERVRTPTPSVTHTPTLSHLQLSIMSPTSAMFMTAPSGRRTPDTMSLLSNHTNPFSVSGGHSRLPNTSSTAPGPVMYELQRDSLTTEIQRSWEVLQRYPSMPISLQLHLTLELAISNFRKGYKNEPPLSLVKDCISTKVELRDLRDIEHLMCAECLIYGGERAHTEWSLQDLLIHFEKLHLENGRSQSKLDWKVDMLSLPPPATFKTILSDYNLPTLLRDLLQQAEITATIKTATVIPQEPPSLPVCETDPYLVQRSGDSARVPRYLPIGTQETRAPLLYTEERRGPPRQAPQSTAAIYGDLNSSRDVWSVRSRTVKAEDVSSMGSIRSHVPLYEHYEPSLQPSTWFDRIMPSVEHIPSVDPRIGAVRGEPMSRSETIRSHRSRGEIIPASAADDFLSTIDASVDVEMAGSESSERPSVRLSQPISRVNSARGPSSRVSRRHTPSIVDEEGIRRHSDDSAYVLHRQDMDSTTRLEPRPIQSRVVVEPSTQPIERQPSRIVEFDRQGNPLPYTGQVYQELSPPRTMIQRQYIDSFGRPVEPPSPTYVRTFPTAGRNIPETQYADARYTHPVYEQPGYSAVPVYRPERIVDPVTGQTYVAERPPVRQLIEINEEYGRPHTVYDEAGHALVYEYRPVNPEMYRNDSTRYERYPPDYQDRRYQGR